MAHHDIQQEITDKIIAQLEKGAAPWRKPWDGGASLTMPVNKTTGKGYRGINIPLLWASAEEHGFLTQEWASYKQWQDKGEQVRKGEKGSLIVYYDKFEVEKDDKIKEIPFLKCSSVFNCCQLASYDPASAIKPDRKSLVERIAHAEEFFKNTGASIAYDGGNRAFYRSSTDDIHMPLPEAFTGTETRTATVAFYSVLGHEITHWSGRENRCNRQMGKRFGTKEYAAEELVAEMSAAFLCAALEITDGPRDDHACYLASWLEVLKEDKKAIFTAASEASKAVDYLFALQKGEVMALPTNDNQQPQQRLRA